MPSHNSRPIAWNDGFLLGYAPIDHIHEEFVNSVAALKQAPDEDVTNAFRALAVHLREHFDAEDAWMTDTAYPARRCHMDEHVAVMQSVEAVRMRVDVGDYAEARRLADALAEWFPGHADYLDAPLAHWMCKRRFGGKPVVWRRQIPLCPQDAVR